ncbi:MAG TPA: prepilin-type N-terminal cleavage/methylation domain-containing protein [Acidobacteriota bacterium]|nr:prepilin-type N-terminal cleavage/methylation domain-containing protein [Acidobacteriota bacterium]
MRTRKRTVSPRTAGFTMVELLVGSAVMLIAVLGALLLYSRSNMVSVEQQMVTEVQSDVRSSMYFVTRDLRMAGVGLPEEFGGYFIEGTDNEDQNGAEVTPDRVKIMGNMEDPLNLPIRNYQGSSVVLDIYDFSFEQYPYPDAYYANQTVIVLPNPDSGCVAGEIRICTHVTHSTGGANERFNFSPGLAPGIDPPGGLSGTCPVSNDYDGGTVSFIDVKEYWLDVTGNYPGLTAGVNGYIGGGEGGILYCTHNGIHLPIARNIENFQAEYNGDMDNDLMLDGWSPWQAGWPISQTSRVQQVRVWILGRTPQAFTSVGGHVPGANPVQIYRRPAVSNTVASAADDMHKRYLLDSTSNVRNLSLSIYNYGQR